MNRASPNTCRRAKRRLHMGGKAQSYRETLIQNDLQKACDIKSLAIQDARERGF